MNVQAHVHGSLAVFLESTRIGLEKWDCTENYKWTTVVECFALVFKAWLRLEENGTLKLKAGHVYVLNAVNIFRSTNDKTDELNRM